jgi:hypothetical protein
MHLSNRTQSLHSRRLPGRARSQLMQCRKDSHGYVSHARDQPTCVANSTPFPSKQFLGWLLQPLTGDRLLLPLSCSMGGTDGAPARLDVYEIDGVLRPWHL